MSTVASPAQRSPGGPLRWTVDRYLRLCQAGIIQSEDRVELLDGEITTKMGQNPPHLVGLMLLVDALRAALGPGFRVDSQVPVLASDSLPEPDAVVLRGTPRDYVGRYPTPDDALLVAEVSDTSIAYDRVKKAEIYARAGFAEYWILNVTDRQLETYRTPLPSGVYGETRIYREDESAEIERATLRVADLLP